MMAENRADVALDRPNRGLYLPPLIWDMMHQFTHDAVLMVLASERYDPAEYIRDYNEFLQLVNQYESTFP
jgi:UDP-2-acetamido-3-amino-2,3-dideoxy-glucuronate N-acetyltransferase